MELDLHGLDWSRFGGHVLDCCGYVVFLMGWVCFVGQHCLVLGPWLLLLLWAQVRGGDALGPIWIEG